MTRFSGKVVVVTGGASGIGAATVAAFLGEGARVAVLDRAFSGTKDNGDDMLVEVACDVSEEGDVETAFDGVVDRWGAVDVVVHAAAALGSSAPFHELSLATWRKYIDVNLTGSFLICRAAANRMMTGCIEGRIILVGSVNSFAAEREAAPYVASKGGVRLLTRAAAVDLARFGITVNMVAPGPITTPATAANFDSDDTRALFSRVLPAGGPGQPQDVAAAILFLATKESRFITGTDIVVDGGMFAQILG
ncbi:SDR family NAD(P)-dependent oxidoreductase [Shinella sp.]|uniref:SDR family NAD(P)-dependent oxidoreductase n=1 Tax=Shinella sp. TaxID=1870904 RepID=UPI0029AF04E6|nr:SDR family NAD(P)-dependent oxidoreductase [Shinella sp.]MDX3975340.1 SDR family NAD(P)-dependent oxidoreductase [Shinella sp.]